MKSILLKLAGPLQSWGTDSHFENRNTDRYPSKSAIIGLIAGSLGYRRNDDRIKELNKLDFAVRIDQPGSLMKDYQIATKYKNNDRIERTYVTNRYYLQDAIFIVAVGSRNEKIINDIEKAIRKPYFQQFLGRRALPVNADLFIKTTDVNVIDSLRDTPWLASYWYQKKYIHEKEKMLDIYADSDLIVSTEKFITRDTVLSFSQDNRQHGFRSISKMVIRVSLEHDVIGVIGG